MTDFALQCVRRPTLLAIIGFRWPTLLAMIYFGSGVRLVPPSSGLSRLLPTLFQLVEAWCQLCSNFVPALFQFVPAFFQLVPPLFQPCSNHAPACSSLVPPCPSLVLAFFQPRSSLVTDCPDLVPALLQSCETMPCASILWIDPAMGPNPERK